MSKIKQTKIPVVLTEEGLLKIAIEQGVIENEFNWQLVREGDGLTKKSKEVMWLEWNELGRFKEKHENPRIGCSLIMSPFNESFTWQTTGVKEIIEETEDVIKFSTNNSIYTLTRIKNETTG